MAQAGVIASEPPQTLRSQTNALSGTQGFFRKLFGRQSGSNTPCKPTEQPKSPQHEVDSADLDKGGLIRRMSRRVVPGLPRAQTFKRQVSERRTNLSPIEPTPDERRAVSMDRRSYRPRSPSASQPATNPRVSAPSFLGSPQDEIPRFVPSISVNDVTDEPPREPADGILHPDEEMTLADECPAQDTLSDTRSITASQYDAIIHEELEKTWILNLSMHFRDRSKREKFFVTYRERDHLWRRVTISLDYRDAPPNSLEMDLINTHYQREKSAKIYEAIRESLRDIQFYDTVTNLKLQTTDGRLHVHVVEDGNEIIQYPTVAQIKHLGCRRIRERDITFESHMSGFVYKVNVNGHTLIKKEIPSPDTIDEFLYEINALNALRSSRNVIHFYGVVVDDQDQNVKGLLINYADQGALIDVIYEHCKDGDYDLPWATRERWARQIVEGLSDIHESGFVQGDFTLSNIVIDGYGDAKIIDINRRGCPVGWEPPEATPLIESNQRITMYIGVKSDLYQLGMVLWALATQEDEPEAQGRPLILGPEVNIPDWYRQMAEVCLSNDPRMRLQASALLEMFPRQRESEETGQLNPPESIIDEGYTLHQYLVDGYHPDNLPQIRTVEPPNDWSTRLNTVGNVTPGDNGTVIRDGAQDTKEDAPGERANGEKSLLSAEKGEDVGGEETKEAQALYQETGNTLEGLPKMNDSQETQMLQEGGKTEDHQTTSANERDVSEEPNTKAELDAEQNAAEKQGSTVPGTDQATMEKEMIAGKADNRENGKVTEGGVEGTKSVPEIQISHLLTHDEPTKEENMTDDVSKGANCPSGL
ncbi:Protein kinase domain [Fusarium oxysporum f. sp. vasinfectum]|nr:Protein kinase domain [Fusarium oxysporum f. sp. vasinfectum]